MLANVVYLFALTLLSPLIVYRMLRFGRYRRGVRQKLFGLSRSEAARWRGHGADTCIWIHAVSVGEVNLLPGVVRQFEAASPRVAVVISTSTDTGYDLAVKHFGAERVFFCPLDFSWAVRRTFKNLQPQKLVLAELELWPNLIRIAKEQGCEVMVMNGRLSDRSAARYQKFSRLTRATFANLSWVGCQDEKSRANFSACGVPRGRLQVTGSLKFDGAPNSRETTAVQACAAWAGVDPWHRVWVVGSTQAGEEAMAIQIYQVLSKQYPELRLIIVPRHQERFDEVARLISSAGLKVHRRSSDRSLYDQQWENDRVILIDTIGELAHWWGVGQIATVGGSFGDRGGQNMLEPAGYGSAISFGPNTRNFAQIANWLLEAGGAVRVADAAELKQFVQRCLDDIPAADSLGRAAREVVAQHRGATERTIKRVA
jgi:3-deoxy-D-manno-octulosonic-acid transferase